MKNGLTLLILMVLSVTAYAQPTNGLLCHYDLDNNFIDDSGNGINGIPSGTYSFVEDRNGNPASALQIFNSPSIGYVQSVFPTGANQNDSTFTLAFWYNSTKTQTQTFPQVISSGYAVYSTVQNSAFIDSSQFNFGTQSSTGSYHTINLIIDTNWNHLTFTLSTTGVLKAYVNGALKGQQTMNTNNLNYAMGGLMLANYQSNGSNNGDIYDDIYYYNRELSYSEIQQVYTETSVCIVNIPDANFKAALLADPAINTNNDGEIECAEASAFTGAIAVNGLNISDLTGIEAFTALTSLDCGQNQLSSLDLSQTTFLTSVWADDNAISSINVNNLGDLDYLDCSNNQLTSIDLSLSTGIETLRLAENQLSTLDVSMLYWLEELRCSYNPSLSALDVSSNPALNKLSIGETQISSISTSNNPNLTQLFCENAQLTSLDLTNNTNLNILNCSGNQLSALNLTANTQLTQLHCHQNNLTQLNVNAQGMLTQLMCWGNNLSALKVVNGNNANMFVFNAEDNPNLTCIEVDDATWSTTNWTNIDVQSSFSEDCASVSISELKHTDLHIYPNPTNDFLHIEAAGNIQEITISDPSGSLVQTEFTPSFSVHKLAAGMYIINVKTHAGIAQKRFVKQ